MSSRSIRLLRYSALPLMAAGLGLLLGSAFEHGPANAGSRATATYSSTAGLAKGNAGTVAVDTSPASRTLKSGLDALDRNDMNAALQAREKLAGGSLERKILAWSIALDGRGVDAVTLNSIADDLAHWPGSEEIRANIESSLIKSADDRSLLVAFSASSPETDEAAIALAIAQAKAGDKRTAHKTIAPVWHSSALSNQQQNTILKEIGNLLTKEDHRARVEYLLGRDRINDALRLAGDAGATRMIAARAAVERKQRDAANRLASVPAFQQSDPNFLFSKARHLRHKNDLQSAAKVLLSVRPASIHPNARDEFWTEHRILASDLLEEKQYQTAYRLAAHGVAGSVSKKIDAEFYAGWLALRKIGDAKTAGVHFARLLKMATTPLSRSRGYYWLARAQQKNGDTAGAKTNYAKAARYDTTFYGQLAGAEIGQQAVEVSKARPTRTDRANFTKYELVQAIMKLESAGHPGRARPIYRFLARHMQKPGELALLAARAEKRGDYQLSLQVGKIGFTRGFEVDNLSWPLGAIPSKTKTSGAGLPLAYAIARQESTFQVDARSSANALGLLQLLPGTAKRTASKIGLKYSKNRLVTDPSYNAQLGTAYLTQQMDKFDGSFVLTFAAYNAGPSRALDWIERNGDPRGQSVEAVIDWVEKIPFSETRNYVQRVMENYQVYKARLKGDKLTIEKDLRRGKSG